jgi:xanthine/CO dehydrogenase XdhC/CoxF family maturation factor
MALALPNHPVIQPAATAIMSASHFEGDPALFPYMEGKLESWGSRKGFCHAGPDFSVLLIRIDPPPRVLICGAGQDSIPVAQQSDMLGWECVVVDHRSAFANTDRFPTSTKVICLEPSALEEQVDTRLLSAAIVMSHNLIHDKTYLAQLSGKELPYLGLLGPAKRRETLMDELGITGQEIHGPAGLDIGAELPESIALSIVAEIHSVLSSNTRSDA